MTSPSRRRIAGSATWAVGLSLLALGSAPASAAEAADGTTVIVLSTDDRFAEAAGEARTIAESVGGRLRTETPEIGAASVEVPAGRADEVRRKIVSETAADVVRVSPPRRLFATPNDEFFHLQAAYLDEVRARAAWDVSRGSTAIRIAVVDTGVMVTHPDLRDRIVGTYNAVDGSSNVNDTQGHGTMVAGVAAAASHNGSGIAGAAWNASILAVKVSDAAGEIRGDAVSNGIVWAANNGAHVINVSLGSEQYDPQEESAIQYALSKGASVVAAAGNAGMEGNPTIYPAALAGVLSVGATHGTARAPFSSYGSWVDVAAPGVGIGGARNTGGYGPADGTSFAAPLVAGQVALLRTVRPSLTPAAIESTVKASGTGIGGPGLGTGRVDFRRSLDLISRPSAPRHTALRPGAGRATLTWTTPALAGGSAITGYRVQFRKVGITAWTTRPTVAASVRSFTQTGLANGARYQFRATALNKYGAGSLSQAPSAVVGRATSPRKPRAAGLSTSSARVTWWVPQYNGGSAITKYSVHWRAYGSTTWRYGGVVGASARSFTKSGLPMGRYQFRVAAVTALGRGLYTGAVTATVADLPGTPTGLAAAAGEGFATLTWTPPASDGGSAVTSYLVQSSAAGSSTWTTVLRSTGTTAFPTWPTGGEVRYRVAAVNGRGTGAYSTPVTVVVGADVGNTQAAAASLSVGGPVQGSLADGGDLDWYSFTLAESTPVVMSLRDFPGDYALRLYEGGGALRATSANAGAGTAESLSATLPAGTYALRVSAELGTSVSAGDQYTLSVVPGV